MDRPVAVNVSRDAASKLVTKGTRLVFNRSQILVPVDTGLLRASGSTDITGNSRVVKGTITYTTRYAAAVHNGRGPLTIRPRRKRGVLKFEIDGKVIFAKSVFQPARKGRPYLLRALQEKAPPLGFSVRSIAYIRT